MTRTLLLCSLACAALLRAEVPLAPPELPPDARYKADILLIVAHPDDETVVSGYLARALYDEHRRVAAIFGTRGNGGGNEEGNEQAASLGAVREIEARRALAFLGVMNVWFLNGPDTPGQDVLRSLETWNHGASLGQVVRLIRLTRPETILTWLPEFVAGENHGDHQAASVLATEGFDLAGDRTAFPEQLAAPRDRRGMSNLTEGLLPWQPKKLYYFSDASHTDFTEGGGPTYSTADVSASRHVTYARLAAEEMEFHLTQGDAGQLAKAALAKGDLHEFEQPVRLVFGKSLVAGAIGADVFEGVTPGPAAFSPAPGYRDPARTGLSMELGGPWAFYRAFWAAHGLNRMAGLLRQPEVAIAPGETLRVPILIHNDTAAASEVTLTVTLPEGWKEQRGTARYPVAPMAAYPVQTALLAPSVKGPAWREIVWRAEAGGREIGSIRLRVTLGGGGLPE